MTRKRNDRNFELVFFPKELGVTKKFEKVLLSTESFEKEVKSFLKESRITPTKIVISRDGTGKKTTKLERTFEGFSWKKFKGKVRGEKKGLFRTKNWKSDFQIYLLSGSNRDGLLFRTEETDPKEMRQLGTSIYNRFVESIVSENGMVPWQQITRVGETVDPVPFRV